MKIRNIIFYFIGILALCSCDDMFEPADENTRQIDVMYEESNYAHGLLMYAYDRLPYITTSQTDVATDDAVTNAKSSAYRNMTTGAWAADNDPMTQWTACKNAIQYVNLFLTVVDKVDWAQSAKYKQAMFVDRLKGEAHALRAIFYYHLLQAHAGYADDGILYGVPLLLEPEDGSSDFNQPRATFADCVQQCIADCDIAIDLLPADYKNVSSNDEVPTVYKDLGADKSAYNLVMGEKSKGLVSGKVAEAVKAQVALLAISPAFRDQSGITAEQAAIFCGNVLKRIDGVNGLDISGNTWYMNKNKIDKSTEMAEILWRQDRSGIEYTMESENFPPTHFGTGRINPSQNLVDAFPMLNGRPITDPASGYDPQNPYANRDPRLGKYIIYNGASFNGGVIYTAIDMPDADGLTNDNLNSTDDNSTLTGYYMSKLLRDDVSLDPKGSKQGKYHIYPRIRYTELFLAFAEAANEAWGPDGDPQDFKFTAYSVIDAIRNRAGLGYDMGVRNDSYLEECKSDKAKMRELIRNERRIELCFENKRFWDLRRWQMPLNESIEGMKIELNDNDGSFKYTKFKVEERNFDSSYQWYGPIPRSEILKWSELKQNRGWQ